MKCLLSSVLWSIAGPLIAQMQMPAERWIDLSGHPEAVMQTVWLPGDGEKVLSGDWRGNLLLWDVPRGQNLATLKIEGGFVRSLEVFDGGKRFIACTNKRLVIGTVQPLALRYALPASGIFFEAVVSPDGQTAAVLTAERRVEYFNCETGDPKGGVDLLEASETLAWLPDGRLVLSSFKSEFATFQGTQAAAPIKLPAPLGRVTNMLVSPDGKNLAITASSSLYVIPLGAGLPPLQISPASGTLTSAAWTSGGNQLVTSSDDGSLMIFDANDGRKLALVNLLQGQCNAVTASADGRWIVTGGGTYSDPQARPPRQMTGDNRVRALPLLGGSTFALRDFKAAPATAVAAAPPVMPKAAPPAAPTPAAPASPAAPPLAAGAAAYVSVLESEMTRAASADDLYLALLLKQERDLVMNRQPLPAAAHASLRDLRARHIR
ncbi:MAG: WD40 repeat domain-containing protein [Verrucomicrobiaceae bacterium]|nr:WD40 repeat domain-containing protein [Verrucomicrobiaceae bacterium]